MSVFFFKQKTAYEMRISDWSSDVCSSDLELLRDRLGDQLRVEFGLADLGDVDVRRDAHQVGYFLAQLLDVLAALADHHARASGVDRHARGLGRTLDRDAADPGRSQLLAQHLADLQVGDQVPGVVLSAGILRSEERRGGKGGVSSGRSRWSPVKLK